MKLLSVGLPGRESRRRVRSVPFQNDAFVVGPKIKMPRNKFRGLINADCFWIANIFADGFPRLNNIFVTIAKIRIHNW